MVQRHNHKAITIELAPRADRQIITKGGWADLGMRYAQHICPSLTVPDIRNIPDKLLSLL